MNSRLEPTKTLIDLSENSLRSTGRVLDLLLSDKSSGENIVWATDSYVQLGSNYSPEKPIQAGQITGKNGSVIQPRAAKSREEQNYRKREKAEVFTPLRIVERMNLATDVLLGFRKLTARNWRQVVGARKLEIACGEGPFIAGRYDPTATNQKVIKASSRVGFLDLKMQAINKFVGDKVEWRVQALRALKATYGFEWQGDSLLIARENVLQTVNDFYIDKFGDDQRLEVSYSEECAEVIAWNIFQMDGLKFVVPMSCVDVEIATFEQQTFFDEPDRSQVPTKSSTQQCPGCLAGGAFLHNGVVAKIKDWETGKVFNFNAMLNQ
jgi:hypothetical protein